MVRSRAAASRTTHRLPASSPDRFAPHRWRDRANHLERVRRPRASSGRGPPHGRPAPSRRAARTRHAHPAPTLSDGSHASAASARRCARVPGGEPARTEAVRPAGQGRRPHRPIVCGLRQARGPAATVGGILLFTSKPGGVGPT